MFRLLLALGTISPTTVRSKPVRLSKVQISGAELDNQLATQPTVVIVVDDNFGFLKSVARLLTVHGFATRTFSSAEALLDDNDLQTAACLLLDIHLGGISGIELQRRLVASGSNCPVIFMTAIDDDATRKAAIDAGCIAYLRKPFAPQSLLDAILKAVA